MLKNIRNIDYVILPCDDIHQMKIFYHETMGFPIYRENPTLDDWIEFRIGSVLLALRKRGSFPNDGNIAPGKSAVQLAFRVTPQQVSECAKELKSKQITVWGPQDNDWGDWGHRNIFFQDPEGNLLEIYADIEFQ